MKTPIFNYAAALSITLLSSTVIAADHGLENCIKAVKAAQPGFILKLEKLNAAGKGVYEIEVADANKGEWEFMCDVDTGKILEKETEVSDPQSLAFKKNMKVTEDDAKAIALKAFPGTIEEVEYEIEDNGSSSYEFDIVSDKGVETKVEVDAATGKIIETATEEWEAGEETEEKR